MARGGAPAGYVGHGGSVGAPHAAFQGGGLHGPHGPGFASNPGHHPSHPIHYPYYGWRYPWWGYRGYYGYPWGPGWYGGSIVVWSDPSSSYPAETDPGYAYPPPDNSSANITYEQQREIDRLSDEVARLRAESAPANLAHESPAAQVPAEAVLVFRDHHSEKIQNYAITGTTLWVFTQERARKIPIAELDIPATTKANADRGIDFRLPGN